jgi:hypothetical protein
MPIIPKHEIKRTPSGELILPEIAKLKGVMHQSQAIGEFIDWLEEQDIHICCYADYDGRQRRTELTYLNEGKEKLLARYFEIDLNRVDDEKRAILEDLRKDA